VREENIREATAYLTDCITAGQPNPPDFSGYYGNPTLRSVISAAADGRSRVIDGVLMPGCGQLPRHAPV
jgi:hypothetical protein